MKNWCVVLFLLMSWSTEALADDKAFTATLLSPEDGWVNRDQCNEEAANIFFNVTFSGMEQYQTYWSDTTAIAEFFVSNSKDCSTKDYLIEGDQEIDNNMSQFRFPDDFQSDDFSFADLKAYNSNLVCEDIDDEFYFCMQWEDELDGVKYRFYGGAQLILDFELPQKPTGIKVYEGESNLKVEWNRPSNDSDIDRFRAFCARKEDPEKVIQDCNADGGDTRCTLSPLTNNVEYVVWVVSEDDVGNQSEKSAQVEGVPVVVDDFYEYYRKQGGADQGGFCFVATAAYGSYNDPMVKQLRTFRDHVLAGNAPGEALINSYYRLGPRWARAIRGSESQKTVARWSLAPAVGLARLSQANPLEWILFISIGFVLVIGVIRFRHCLSHWIKKSHPALLVLVLLCAANAQADEFDKPSNISIPGYQLQLRFGPYFPDVDAELPNEKPFKNVFGGSSEFLFELGIDYQIWRGFGAVTAGVSTGFVQFLGKGHAVTDSTAKEDYKASNDTTILNLIPLRLSAGYHLTFLYELWNIPLIPYVQTGLSYYIWWVTDGVGNVATSSAEGKEGDGYGGVFGMHLGMGFKFLLDILDPTAAANLETDIGVINTFLFAEYNMSWINGFESGESMDFSDNTVMFGLMMEF